MNIELLSLPEAIESFNLLVALGLFALYALVEALDVSLTLSITKHESIKSANKVLLLYIVLGIEILAFVSNYLYAVPIALGAWLGTYLQVEREKKKRPLKKENNRAN